MKAPWEIFRPDPATNYKVILPGHRRTEDIVLRRSGPRSIGQSQASVNLRQTYVWHSPTGFEWGYGGSGPADLALNILALVVPHPEAFRLHHDYKQAVIARIPDRGGVIRMEDVVTWVRAVWRCERKGNGQ